MLHIGQTLEAVAHKLAPGDEVAGSAETDHMVLHATPAHDKLIALGQFHDLAELERAETGCPPEH